MKANCIAFWVVVFFVFHFNLDGQPPIDEFKDVFRLTMKAVSGDLKIDGTLDEAAWLQPEKATEFSWRLDFENDFACFASFVVFLFHVF